jgi:hypothetical protein
VVLARRAEDLRSLKDDPLWVRYGRLPGATVWTDDYADVLGAVQWSP